MSKPREYVLVPGIRHRAGEDSWVSRLADLLCSYGCIAHAVEYYAWIYRTARVQRNASRELAETIMDLNARGVVPDVVTHSNGGVILCRALSDYHHIRIRHAHIVAAAAWRSFARNGLNDALSVFGSVERITVYASRGDKVLKYGGVTRVLYWLGKGYGRLGYTGPKDVADACKDRVHVVQDDTHAHSTWFAGRHLRAFLPDPTLEA